MISKQLKNAVVFSVMAAVTFVLLVACQNPFKTDMGKKVDVTPPVVEDVEPVSGAFIKDVTVIRGRASAYRQLEGLEVRILKTTTKDPEPISPEWDWTTKGIEFQDSYFVRGTDKEGHTVFTEKPSTAKDRGFTFTIDTFDALIFKDNAIISDDGLIKIQFRAIDPSQNTETIEYLYYIKNKPTIVKIVEPNVSPSNMEGSLVTGDGIRGQVTDRRGLKPGYPLIKIWSEDEPEPGDDMWASLFLEGGTVEDGFDEIRKNENGSFAGAFYTDRSHLKVLNAAAFTFPLFEFELYDGADGFKKIRYPLSDSDNVGTVLKPNTFWYFKIKTSDTCIDEDMLPCVPPAGDSEIVGFFPPLNYGRPDEEDPKQEGSYVTLKLISSGTPPVIELDNNDLAAGALDIQPNIYITEPTSRKISDFRLRVYAYQPDGIAYSTLEYSHGGSRGFLQWDGNAADYMDNGSEAAKAVNGHKGAVQDDGKIFTITANASTVSYSDNDDAGSAPVFTTSTEPYRLIITAYTAPDLYSVKEFSVYIYGDGPKAEIRSIRGATEEPAGTGISDYEGTGNTVNPNPYTVNSIMQVFTNYPSPFSILQSDGKPLVKWAIETRDPFSDPDALINKLKTYRNNPFDPANSAFFYNISETLSSGWVNTAVNRSFKFDTRDYGNSGSDDLWLYVIAQDSVYNLGFILQKITVAQSTDIPVIEDNSLFKDINSEIAGEMDLLAIVGANGVITDGNTSRLNILEKSQGISLGFKDDDGINLENNGFSVTLTYLNNDGEPVTCSDPELLSVALTGGNARDMSGILSQEIMAQILGVPRLNDGLYKIEFTIKDDIDAKVHISAAENDFIPSGTLPPGFGIPESKETSKTYYFAVFTDDPALTINWLNDERNLGENTIQNEIPGLIGGTLKTGIPLKTGTFHQVQITFTPNIYDYPDPPPLTPPEASDSSPNELFTLYGDEYCNPDSSIPYDEVEADEDGIYTYYWMLDKNISFNPGEFDNDANGIRTIVLSTFDGLGNAASLERNVFIDTEPPEVEILAFNDPKGTTVHGKVEFTVNVTDNRDLAADIDANLAGVRWYLLPVLFSTPDWDSYQTSAPANVLTGQFALPPGNYDYEITNLTLKAIMNTRSVPDGMYNLYVIAEDKATNVNLPDTRLIQPNITVNQSLDNPELNEDYLDPKGGALMENIASGMRISGTVRDDDTFDRDKIEAGSPFGNYVMIRFPLAWYEQGTVNANYSIIEEWGEWLPVTSATLDNTGEIITFTAEFSEYQGNANFNAAYFDGEGPRLYELKVVDEPSFKNPDGAQPGQSAYIGAATTAKTLTFLLDTRPPEITFAASAKYEGINPTYQNSVQFMADLDLGGRIIEENPLLVGASIPNLKYDTVVLMYGDINAVISGDPININDPEPKDFHWNIDNLTTAQRDELIAAFNAAPQGPQSITVEASDKAGLTGNGTFSFYKDTQGPEISFSGTFVRVIDYGFADPTDVDSFAFPGDWPLDWPDDGDDWVTEPGWAALRAAGVADWPTEFKFMTETEVKSAIKADMFDTAGDLNIPPVVYKPASDGKYYISGKFDDELSPVWNEVASTHLFYYRFDDPVDTMYGRTDSFSYVEWANPFGSMITAGQKPGSALWEIEVPDGLADGLHYLDIRVADVIGNVSEIFGIQFIIDRNAPTSVAARDFDVHGSGPGGTGLFDGNDPFPKPLPEEAQRVFSANNPPAYGDAGSTNIAYILTGSVFDNNLSQLVVEIFPYDGSEDPIRAEINLPFNAIVGVPFDSEYAFPANPPTVPLPEPELGGVSHLSVTKTALTNTAGQTQWDWTLTVRAGDLEYILDNSPASLSEGARRVIRITATDISGKKSMEEGKQYSQWRFFLDSTPPEITRYTNLKKESDGLYVFQGSRAEDVVPQGIVNDANKIKDIKYLIGKWIYDEVPPNYGQWRWWDGVGWNLTDPPAPLSGELPGHVGGDPVYRWPSMLNPPVAGSGLSYGPAEARIAVDWKLTQTVLQYSGGDYVDYPGTLFQDDGKYRLDLCITDWSLHDTESMVGNPVTTVFGNFNDDGGIASARAFYVDRKDPVIEWVGGTTRANYRNNPDGSVTFDIILSDANTVSTIDAYIEAEVETSPGSGDFVTFKYDSKLDGGITINSSTYVSPNWVYNVSVEPFMTYDGTSSISNVDWVSGLFTIELTVIDGTGRRASSNRTKSFTLDNEPPTVQIFDDFLPQTNEALTGRIKIMGDAEDDSGRLGKIAYYLGAIAPDPGHYGESAFGWHYLGDANDGKLMNGDQVMLEIHGSKAWNIVIDNARYLEAAVSPNVDWTEKSAVSGLLYDGMDIIPSTDKVGLLTLWMYVEDEAGNQAGELGTSSSGVAQLIKREYWLWPNGDLPIVTRISYPDPDRLDDRLLNGAIRVAGSATDNERVKNVWISVRRKALPGDPPANVKTDASVDYYYYTNLIIPEWDEFEDPITRQRQKQSPWDELPDRQVAVPLPKIDPAEFNPGEVWYKANGGGSRNVSWRVLINTNGELDGKDGNTNEIEIEIRAEDSTSTGVDQWSTGDGQISIRRLDPDPMGVPPTTATMVNAFMVAGAPEFDSKNEMVKSGLIDTDPPLDGVWSNINYTNVGQKASYRIPVKSKTGVSSIRWIPTIDNGDGTFKKDSNGANTVSLFSYINNNLISTTGTGPGITVKAMPYPGDEVSGSATFTAGEKYLVYKYDAALSVLDGKINSGDAEDEVVNAPCYNFIIYTTGTYNIGSAILIKADNYGYFRWLVTVEVDTTNATNSLALENGKYRNDAVLYPIYLEAYDTSEDTNLRRNRTARLPIDNLPPEGRYTQNPRFAGMNATIGGEARDEGDIGGLQKVIVWFSRNIGGVDTKVSWREKDPAFTGAAWIDGEELSAGTYFTSNGRAGTTNLTLPYYPGWDTLTDPDNHEDTDGDYAFVIDRTGMAPHHGSTKDMGFGPGGDMGTAWWVSFDSTMLESGPLTLHFVVYDKAGNTRYYTKHVVNMNGAPMIDKMKLATDISNTLSTSFASSASVMTNNTNVGSSFPLQTVRGGTPYASERTDVQKGITESFGSKAFADGPKGPYGAVMDLGSVSGNSSNALGASFNVRNKLLALRVDAATAPVSNEKARTIRVEYVTHGKPVTIDQIKAGKVYMINSPGNSEDLAAWGAVGAMGDRTNWVRGFAFLASSDGKDEDGVPVYMHTITASGPPAITSPEKTPVGTAWELNGNYYGDTIVSGKYPQTGGTPYPTALNLGDVTYPATYPAAINTNAMSGEFVFNSAAFGTTAGSTITDVPAARADSFGQFSAYPDFGASNPWDRHSLFIVKIFDGPENDAFADFALLSINVNNIDSTRPFAQLYDMNPATEGQTAAITQANALKPATMGANRVKGGLLNTSATSLVKSGHIEPRNIPSAGSYAHTLTSAQMGGVPGTTAPASPDPKNPWADPSKFNPVDTVSGRVILRGYAEDDQEIESIDLLFYPDNTGSPATVNILTNVGGHLTKAGSIGAAVEFEEYKDVYRHRVEWAYYWDTAAIPSTSFVVGDVTVRAVAYNSRTGVTTPLDAVNKSSERVVFTDSSSTADADAVKLLAYGSLPYNANTPSYQSEALADQFPMLPGNVRKYNTINMEMRPYIAGFKRNTSLFYHNKRSLQGWYTFSRGEEVVVNGFSIGVTGATTSITFTGAAAVNTSAPAPADQANFELDSTVAAYYQKVAVPGTAEPGKILLTVTKGTNAYSAANTTRDNYAQPWNIEYDAFTDGSDLWDDYTSAHIWHSANDDAGTVTADRGYFPATANWNVADPSMTIDPATGTLYSSHVELGSGDFGASVRYGNNAATTLTTAATFNGNIVNTDIAYSGAPITAYSIQGRNGNSEIWNNLGGIYFNRANGQTGPGTIGNQHLVESAWYNASRNSTLLGAPPAEYQFSNPHIAMSDATTAHISYYDTKDGSIKYQRKSGNETAMPGGTSYDTNAVNRKTWINLDGGFDGDDRILTLTTGAHPHTGVNPSRITGGTDFTLTQAFPAYASTPRFVREVMKGVGQEVEKGETIFVIGRQNPLDIAQQEEVIAQRSGLITYLEYPEPAKESRPYTTRQALARSGYVYSMVTNTATASGANNNQVRVTGAYSPTANYNRDDIVSYGGRWYIYIQDGAASGQAPDTPYAPGVTLRWSPFGDWTTATTLQARGAWASGTTYTKGDMVHVTTSDNAVMICVADTYSGTVNPLASFDWQWITAPLDMTGQVNDNTFQNNAEFISNGVTVTEGQIICFIGMMGNGPNPTNPSGSQGSYGRYAIRAPASGIITGLPAANTEINGGKKEYGFTYTLFSIQSENFRDQLSTTNTVYSIADVNPTDTSFSRIVNASTRGMSASNYNIATGAETRSGTLPSKRPKAGEHNAIALTSAGIPVVAYFDSSNQKLKLAVGSTNNPNTANLWRIRNNVIPTTHAANNGTGKYVSIKIDANDYVHIAAMKSAPKQLIYITGKLNPGAGTAGVEQTDTTTSNVLTDVIVQAVDTIGNVGSWCNISLDSEGNPWIAYQDENNLGSMDGVKMAFKSSDYTKFLPDDYGNPITGWETMHVPAQFRVEDARIGIANTDLKFWSAAVGYLSSGNRTESNNRYRIAYYVKKPVVQP